MGDWPIGRGFQAGQAGGYDGSNSWGVNITSHASANTKGNYTALHAAVPFDVALLVLMPNYAPPPYDFLLDLSIGGVGAEQVLIPDLLLSAVSGSPNDGRSMNHVAIPLNIPKASRIAARVQSSTGGQICALALQLFSAAFVSQQPSTRVVTYGAVTADSGGTSIDPGGTANAKGGWTELVAAVDKPLSGFFLSFGSQRNTARTWASWRVDVGIGSGGNEVVIVPDINMLVATLACSKLHPQFSVFYPIRIPVGSRIAVRAQCETNDATDRLFDVVLYGLI